MVEARRVDTGTDWAEDDLVAAARSDRAAFTPLYLRYVDPIYRYCYRRLGTREEAEDATSRVFAQALAALPRYRPGAFRSWLFTIAHNIVTDAQRERFAALPLDTVEGWPDPEPGPEQAALSAEDGRTVRALLAQLPPEGRDLMELRLAGLSDREIADVLGRSHGAIRMAQHRTVVRLRTLQAGQEENHRG